MASASSRWKSDRLRPPAITATFTARLLTRVPSKLWLAQLMHGLLPCSIIITDFTLRVPYHTGYFELCAVALHSFSSPCPLKNKLGAFSKPPRHRAQRLPARTVWYPLSQLHPTSHSWPGPGPKTFPFSYVAQCDLNNRSHLICFHHGSKETVFHFMRSQVRETSQGRCPKPIQTAIQINIDWKKRQSQGRKKTQTFATRLSLSLASCSGI